LEKTAGDPSSIFPMETRFLIKRCEEADSACTTEKWQGYSYQWNEQGNEAFLLPGTEPEGTTKDWTTTAGLHAHSYPSRAQCTECHNQAAGRVLGLQAPQLNRPLEYANGIVDNQLRVWTDIGLFGATSPEEAPETLTPLPAPEDVGRSLEERSLSYLH